MDSCLVHMEFKRLVSCFNNRLATISFHFCDVTEAYCLLEYTGCHVWWFSSFYWLSVVQWRRVWYWWLADIFRSFDEWRIKEPNVGWENINILLRLEPFRLLPLLFTQNFEKYSNKLFYCTFILLSRETCCSFILAHVVHLSVCTAVLKGLLTYLRVKGETYLRVIYSIYFYISLHIYPPITRKRS